MIPYTGGESGGMGPGPPFPFIRNQQHHHHHRNQQHHQQHQQQQQLTRALSLGNNRHSFMVCMHILHSISPFKNSLPLFSVHVHVGTGNYANLLTKGNFTKYVLFLLQNLLEIIHLYHNHYTYSYWKPT